MTARVRSDVAPVAGVAQALDPKDAHHLLRVLRLVRGAEVQLVAPDGGLWRAELTGLEPPALTPTAPVDAPSANPDRALEVWVPLLKGGRTDALVRQLTELGATRLVPFVARRTVARPDERRAIKQLARWRGIAEEATRQCRRTDRVEITAIEGLPVAGPGVFFWEEPGPPARTVLEGVGAGRILVGPEGGLAPEEAAQLRAAGWRSAWLGPRILRAETAVVAAATLALAAGGEGGY